VSQDGVEGFEGVCFLVEVERGARIVELEELLSDF
jgi:hypothetical protein